MLDILTFGGMQPGFRKITLDLPEDFHEKLRRYCFDNKTTMKDVISGLIAEHFRWQRPKFVDRRKLTRKDREKLERQKK